MKNITEPSNGLFQVRIRRNGSVHSRCFSTSSGISRKEALDKAKRWRDKTLVELGSINRTGFKTRQNKTTGVHGVSRKLKVAWHGESYLYFMAHYKDNNGSKSREFSAGPLNATCHKRKLNAFTVALLFRKEYEHNLENKSEFKPQRFKNWKDWSTKEIYQFFDDVEINKSEVENYIKRYEEFQKREP